MISVNIKELTVLQFANLKVFAELDHFSTTRLKGNSSGNYNSLNLGYNSGDLPDNVLSNRITLFDALDVTEANFIFPRQTHTATIKVITPEFFELSTEDQYTYLDETDAVITDMKEVYVAIKTADCVPVLLYDPCHGVVAAIHAGWRGTVQNIVSLTTNTMVERYSTNPSDLWAGIGPSISPAVYEVGEEVWSQFDSQFYNETNPPRADKRLLDLWKANYHQLINSGIRDCQIEVAQICTWANPDLFFSARREGAKTGRMATGIRLR